MASERQVFVAYPYAFANDDYRRSFRLIEAEFRTSFRFANEDVTDRQILDKIVMMMRSADLCLFDVTRWNPNVTLELGLAMGHGMPWRLLFNPSDAANPTHDVLSDLRGFDRLEYTSAVTLENGLRALLRQLEFPPAQSEHETDREPMGARDEELERRAEEAIAEHHDGMTFAELRTALDVYGPDLRRAIPHWTRVVQSASSREERFVLR